MPLPTTSSYLAYKNVNFRTFRNDISKSFVPVCPNVNNGAANATWSKAPRVSTTNLDLVHYGHSFLFVKPLNFTVVQTLTFVITAKIEFFTYSGNNGVALRTVVDSKKYNEDLFAEKREA